MFGWIISGKHHKFPISPKFMISARNTGKNGSFPTEHEKIVFLMSRIKNTGKNNFSS